MLFSALAGALLFLSDKSLTNTSPISSALLSKILRHVGPVERNIIPPLLVAKPQALWPPLPEVKL